MKYKPHIKLFRFHEFNHHEILICKQFGSCDYYIDGLFMWTKATGRNGYRLLKKEIDFGPLNTYDDWVSFSYPPKYIPDGQMFNWYRLTWKEHKDEIPEVKSPH